ncbi:MAG: hypothetical protein SFZ23_01365 [Planctomycetota bacterium]|nr:hypothetical protein [Planctomycetota bacterium]
MKSSLLVGLAVASVGSVAFGQTTIAYWAFPQSAPPQNYNITFPIQPDVKLTPGTAGIDSDAPKWDGTVNPTALQQGSLQLFSGSTVNAEAGFDAGQALSLRNDSLNRGEGKSIIIRLDTTDYQDLVLSYAERVTSSGPTLVSILSSLDGANYSPVTSYSTTRSGAFLAAARVIDLSSIGTLENQASIFLKVQFSGFNANSNGAARLDNIKISGTLIPAPGVATLMGLGGLVAARRRR